RVGLPGGPGCVGHPGASRYVDRHIVEIRYVVQLFRMMSERLGHHLAWAIVGGASPVVGEQAQHVDRDHDVDGSRSSTSRRTSAWGWSSPWARVSSRRAAAPTSDEAQTQAFTVSLSIPSTRGESN